MSVISILPKPTTPATVAAVDITIQAKKPRTTLVSSTVAKPAAATVTMCMFSESVLITTASLLVTLNAELTRSTISVKELLNNVLAWESVTSIFDMASRVPSSSPRSMGRIRSAVSPPS